MERNVSDIMAIDREKYFPKIVFNF